jgi:hypothetical protein
MLKFDNFSFDISVAATMMEFENMHLSVIKTKATCDLRREQKLYSDSNWLEYG